MYDQSLAIESVRELSAKQFVLAFESPEIAAATEPGQFVMISVSDAIDPLLRRPMAVCRVLRDELDRPCGFSLVIEVLGRGTALLQQRVPGDRLRVLGPMGNPFRLPDESEPPREHLLVMGGVGAAPFPLVAERLLELGQPVRAFVGARTEELLLCVEDFEEMKVPVELATDDGSRGTHGFVTEPLRSYLEGRELGPPVELYACGPTPMMRAVDRIARARELPLQLSFEAPMACGIGICLSCVLKVRDDGDGGWRYVRCCREGPVFDSRELVWE